MDKVESYEHRGVRVDIYYDESPTSPREFDNATTMVVQADRYADIDEPQFPMEREAFARGDYRLLERYLRTACGVVAFGQWQSHRDCWGYAYVTRERAEELGVADPAGALEAETEEYCDWAQGIVYGFIVADGTDDHDSCWGFIGDIDYCKQEANEAAEWVTRKREERYVARRTLAARRGRMVLA